MKFMLLRYLKSLLPLPLKTLTPPVLHSSLITWKNQWWSPLWFSLCQRRITALVVTRKVRGWLYGTRMNLYNPLFWMASICNFFFWDRILVLLRTLLNKFPNTWEEEGNSFFSDLWFFSYCVDFYTNLYKSPKTKLCTKWYVWIDYNR